MVYKIQFYKSFWDTVPALGALLSFFSFGFITLGHCLHFLEALSFSLCLSISYSGFSVATPPPLNRFYTFF